jgi:hypothetical protein
MSVAPSAPPRPVAVPQSGTGVPCQIAQSDGVPCAEVRVDCEHCERSTSGVCDAHRDATGDAGSEPSHPTKSTHA